jgi:hypothetical protein
MSHVTWPKLLALALRLRTAEAILASGTPLEQFEADGPAKALLDTWQFAAAGQLDAAGRERRSDAEADAEGPAIDAYFGRVGAQLRQQGPALAGRSALAGQLFQLLVDAHDQPACIACCERPEPQPPLAPCRWTRSTGAADAKAMDERGTCIGAVREIFRFAREVSGQAYEEACGAALDTRLHLHTGHGGRNGELNLAVNAETTEHPADELRTRNVRFVFEVDAVSIDDLHAMAYIAVHECVAHGYCGVNIMEPDAAVSVPFHEGWMDCVAAYVLAAAVASGCDGYAQQYANGFQSGMVSARVNRYSRGNPAKAKDVVRWTTGRQAYEAFERLARVALERQGRHATDELGWRSRELVAGFSLALNASDISHAERAAFCTTVNRFYGAGEEPRAARQRALRPQVLDFIESFAKSGDFRSLFHAVSAIH